MSRHAPETPASLSQTPAHWQQAMREAIRDPAELLTLLQLPPALLPAARRAAALFPLRVPRAYVTRMNKGDVNDPLLRQILPLGDETLTQPGYVRDAVGDLGSVRPGGVLHKYHGRALLITTGACAVHCRYCFRRHFPYNEINAKRAAWQGALAQIAADSSLEEIILSGGDPLSLTDARLAELCHALEEIPHVKRLRIHTRTPVVMPERVDGALIAWLAHSHLQIVIVLHANHAQELDDEVKVACERLANAGATLLNQSVLLRGVNDNAQVLSDLSIRLFNLGILPYYLHLLDKVEGAAHFDVPENTARLLWQEMAKMLPGYLVPKLAREQSGAHSKTLLGYKEPQDNDEY